MPLILLGVGSIAALVGSSLMLNASFRLEGKLANWIVLPLLAWGQIVLGSITLSELYAIGLLGFFVWHLAFLLLCLAIWKARGAPDLVKPYRSLLTDIVDFGRDDPVLAGFLLFLTGVLVYSFFNGFTPGDADAYHIPRAHYWIQNRTARHFFNYNYRQTQYPPNASFIYMWQAIVTGSYRFLHLAQWIAVWMTGLTCLGLARRLGFPRRSSVFALGLYLTLPGVIIQGSAPLNDLLVTYAGSVFLFFAIGSMTGRSSAEDLPRATTDAYAGLTFGLLFGTKVTALLMAPSLLVLSACCLFLGEREVRRRLWRVVLACFLGFVLLASYNHVLNFVNYGNPVAASDSIDIEMTEIGDETAPWTGDVVRSTVRNVVRHSYQMMDWDLIDELPGSDRLFHYNLATYLRLDRLLGLGLEEGTSFDLRELGGRRIDPGTVGFGPIGYAFLLASPIVGIVTLVQRPKKQRIRLGMVLLALAWGFIVTQSAVLPWFSSRVRFLSLPLALILAAIAPYLYRNTTLSRILVLGLMLVGGWSAIGAARAIHAFSAEDRQLSQIQTSILENTLPADAQIGVAGYVEFHHILKEFPTYGFTPIRTEEITPAIRSGALEAALVRDPDGRYREYQLPLEYGQSLLVTSPKRLLLANLDSYGVAIDEVDGRATLRIHDSPLIKRTGPDQVVIMLPAVNPLTSGEPLEFGIDFPVPAPEESALDVICEGNALSYSRLGSSIEAILDPSMLPGEAAFLSCELRISDYEFGSQIPSGSIELTLERME